MTGVVVPGPDPGPDVALELFGRAVRAPSQPLLGELGELESIQELDAWCSDPDPAIGDSHYCTTYRSARDSGDDEELRAFGIWPNYEESQRPPASSQDITACGVGAAESLPAGVTGGAPGAAIALAEGCVQGMAELYLVNTFPEQEEEIRAVSKIATAGSSGFTIGKNAAGWFLKRV